MRIATESFLTTSIPQGDGCSPSLGRVTPKELPSQAPIPDLTQFVADKQGRALWGAALTGRVIRIDLKTHKVTSVGCGLIFPSLELTLVNDPAGNVWVTEAGFGGGGAMGRLEH